MEAILICPYAETAYEGRTDRFPLAYNENGPFSWTDITGLPGSRWIPLRNLGMWQVDISEAQHTAISADPRFLILSSPSSAYNHAAADTWLKGKNCTDHPVAANDSLDQAKGKLKDYFTEPDAQMFTPAVLFTGNIKGDWIDSTLTSTVSNGGVAVSSQGDAVGAVAGQETGANWTTAQAATWEDNALHAPSVAILYGPTFSPALSTTTGYCFAFSFSFTGSNTHLSDDKELAWLRDHSIPCFRVKRNSSIVEMCALGGVIHEVSGLNDGEKHVLIMNLRHADSECDFYVDGSLVATLSTSGASSTTWTQPAITTGTRSGIDQRSWKVCALDSPGSVQDIANLTTWGLADTTWRGV